ncbi:MAG: type IV pili twitching motility protein PilT, partial [Chloroflexi bacterium]|nr:type IV pili twitching motility protein PilT [Chloroflexota bacterium]
LPEVLKRLTEYQQGLVLVAGPANCGKTTTLAVLLDMINANRSDHIITIERPIEYVHTPKQCHVTQREVGTNTDSFASALRSALRQDPDVLMVGELTDLETLSMAIRASETGHLVFGTLHTTSAARTVNRILDAFPIAQQTQIRIMLSESLRGVISQHLIPRKDGTGVALAMEILLVTSGVAALLRDNKALQIPSIIQTSRKMGMCLMDDSLLDLVKAGVIDGSVASRYAENKENFTGAKGTPSASAGSSLRSAPSDTDKKRRSSLY